MRVIVTLDDSKETRIEGDAAIFGDVVDYHKGYDKRLANIGFWLDNWRYAGHSGPNNSKSRVFIPWTSTLIIQELNDKVR